MPSIKRVSKTNHKLSSSKQVNKKKVVSNKVAAHSQTEIR